ncbi:MAG TPA: hypothetical protein VMV61_08625 [Patescibacteria group bacterium]|nr:hypothetical protein [Patescibacteria group bacterium]
MQDNFFEEKFDDFRVEVIDRLARIETQHERMIERLDRMNGTLDDHATVLRDHERKLARMRGAAGILAAIIAAAVSMLLSRLRLWFTP